MSINDLTTTIQGIKDAKEDLRGAINAKGGTLANDAKLSEYKNAVEGLPSGASDTSVDFGSSYSEAPESIAQQLKEDLAFTAEVERGIESGEYTPSKLIDGTQKVLFNEQEYVFKDKIAFLPKNICKIKEMNGFSNLKEFLGDYILNETISSLRSNPKMIVAGRNYSITTNGNASYAFAYCYSLVRISIDLTKATLVQAAFENCPCLEYVEIKGWSTAELKFSSSARLKPISVHNIIAAGCKTYKESVDNGEDGGVRVLTLNATALSNWKNSEYYEEDSAQASAFEITIK